MTVFCEPTPNVKPYLCVKCGGTWTDGTPVPECSLPLGCTPVSERSAQMATVFAHGDAMIQSFKDPTVQCYGGTLDELTVEVPILTPEQSAVVHAEDIALVKGTRPLIAMLRERCLDPEGGAVQSAIADAIQKDPSLAVARHVKVIDHLHPNEPFFVLRAQDLLAPTLIEDWCRRARAQGCDPKKIESALKVAREMTGWGGSKKYPD